MLSSRLTNSTQNQSNYTSLRIPKRISPSHADSKLQSFSASLLRSCHPVKCTTKHLFNKYQNKNVAKWLRLLRPPTGCKACRSVPPTPTLQLQWPETNSGDARRHRFGQLFQRFRVVFSAWPFPDQISAAGGKRSQRIDAALLKQRAHKIHRSSA